MPESGLESLICAEFARQQSGEAPGMVERSEDRIPVWLLIIERNTMVKQWKNRTRFEGSSLKHVAKPLGDGEYWFESMKRVGKDQA